MGAYITLVTQKNKRFFIFFFFILFNTYRMLQAEHQGKYINTCIVRKIDSLKFLQFRLIKQALWITMPEVCKIPILFLFGPWHPLFNCTYEIQPLYQPQAWCIRHTELCFRIWIICETWNISRSILSMLENLEAFPEELASTGVLFVQVRRRCSFEHWINTGMGSARLQF
jgi:hypothetical protein